MDNQKLENLLNLALQTPEPYREKSLQLNVGFDPLLQEWEVIIRYIGELQPLLAGFPEVQATPLLGGFAILRLPQQLIDPVSALPEIIYVEKPKRLFFAADGGVAASCIPPMYQPPYGLTGRGVLVAVIDSGLDYAHPDFRNPDGSSRVLEYWDQTVPGRPPEGYPVGSLFSKADLDAILRGDSSELQPSADTSGHGTGVAGIAAGNGRAENGLYQGVAPEADLLIVKLGRPPGLSPEQTFPRTTELMMGIDFAVRRAASLRMPLALNLSFGNNYGSHDGSSLLETYLDIVSGFWKCSVCIGTGNEGTSGGHVSGQLSAQAITIDLSVGPYQPSLDLQIWKSYVDEFEVQLLSPAGVTVGPFRQIQGASSFVVGRTRLLIYYGEPSPYQISQEIFMDFLPDDTYIDSGVWKVQLIPRRIVAGRFDLWLPGSSVRSSSTRFLLPTPDITLTIPSTSGAAISVGAYDSRYHSYAPFSGRGFTRQTNLVKPDLAAPGVEITAPAPGGGYLSYTGTSFATPFVTGSAALMMEWGILQNHDPFLYGEKIKAWLRYGARPLTGIQNYPNPQVGYGTLCLQNSFYRQITSGSR